MAQRLTACSAALILGVGASSAGQAALAQSLSDPMRPPQVSAMESTAEAAAGQGQSRLQSVLISRARRLAVIDGTVVPLGGQVGDATVIAITETGVILKKGEERETLKLYPAVQIKPVPRMQPPMVKK
jgi:MSHA biogenesis protein MshK